MSKILPAPGTYTARRTGAIVVRGEESGSLMAYIPYGLCDSEVRFNGNVSVCIGSKDGTPQKNNISNLKKAFGWDGVNVFDLETIPIPEGDAAEFELADCVHEDYQRKATDENPDPGVVTKFEPSWFNALGGSAPSKEPMTADERKTVLARWQGKLKALSGGKAAAPVAKAAAAKPAPVVAKAAAAGPPGRRAATAAAARTATMEEVWNAYEKKNNEAEVPATSDELGDSFYAAQDQVRANANGDLINPQEWGQVAEILGV